MKKKVTFEKEIQFPSMIGEICAISLEHDLKFVDEANVEGNLILNGKYKLTEASRLEEDFRYKIPTEIALTEKIDLNTSKIEITDFTYDIKDEDTMVCHIELLLEGLEVVDADEEHKDDLPVERECDGDLPSDKEIEIPVLEKREESEMEEEDTNTENEMDENEVTEEIATSKVDINKDSLFVGLDNDTETYGTFLVYIVRQNESVNSIIEKYHTTLEELEKYNDISEINIGTKLIIPFVHD